MEIFAKFILTVAGNLTALLITSYFEHDFIVSTNVKDLLSVVFLLSFLNLTVRPFLRFIFSPLNAITFGYFNIIISAGILYAIDIYSTSLTINGLWPLVLGAHAVGLIVSLIDYSSAMIYSSGEVY